MTNENTETSKKVSIASIVFWVLGIGLIFIGLVSSYTALVISGVVLLPITSTLVKKYLNKNVSHLVRIILAVVLLFLFSLLIGTPTQSPKKAENNNTTQTVSANFDVPTLVGKSLAELDSTLGTPTKYTEPTQLQINSGVDTWEKTWSKDKVDLMVTYDIKTKAVVDLFLGGNFENTDSILKSGNLSTTDSNYSVEFIKARNGSGYTGAIIKKK